MKKNIGVLLALLLANTCVLSGCIVTPLTELTDEENKIISTYSAKVVAKYNVYQKDGLNGTLPTETEEEQKVKEETEETEEIEETSETKKEDKSTESKKTKDDSESEKNDSSGSSSQTPETTLAKLIGHENDVTVTFSGTTSKKSYIQNGVYSVTAKSGRIYAVVNLKLTNTSGANITLDNMASNISITAKIGGKTYNAAKTLLNNDFLTYSGTLAANSSVDTVMLFEIPKDQAASLGDISLEATVNGTKNAVKL